MSVLKVAVLCGSLHQPSRTLALCETLLTHIKKHIEIKTHIVEISQIGRIIGSCMQFSELPVEIQNDIDEITNADLVIAASPVYSASYTGLFKHFVDFLGKDALSGVPVLLAATGGSSLHGLVIDHLLRPLFVMKQALVLPLGVYATEADFTDNLVNSPALEKRITLAINQALPFLKPISSSNN